jgi:hypothetical protein
MVRPFFWALAFLAVLVLISVLLLESDFARERARRWVIAELEARLSRPVSVDSVELELWPLSVELEGVEIASRVEGEPPFLELGRLLVDARSIRLRGPAVELGRVLIERPVVRLFYRDDGSDNLPRRPPREPGEVRGDSPGSGLDLTIGELTLFDGALELDQQRLPLSLAAGGVRASLLGGTETWLAGRLDADEVTLLLPRAEPFLGEVSLRVELDDRHLGVVSGSVHGPHLELDVGGHLRWRGGKEVSLDVEARGDGRFLDELGYSRGRIRGAFAFDGGWLWQPRLWGYRGTLSSSALEVFGRRLEHLSAAVAGDRNGVSADLERATYGEGRLTGTIAYRHKAEGRPLELDLELEEASLARLLADQRIPLTGVDAAVSGPFRYTFPARSPERGDGEAELELAPRQPAGPLLQLAGTAPLEFDGGELRSEAILVVSEAQHALALGRYDIPTRSGRFDVEIGSDRLDELMGLLPIAPATLDGALWAPDSGSGRVWSSFTLSPAGMRTEVRLDLSDVVAPGYQAEEARGWLSLDRGGVYDLRVELAGQSSAAIVSGAIPFGEGSERPFELTVDAASWPSSSASRWLPFELPLVGPLSGSLQLRGDPAAPEGTVRVTMEPAAIAGAPVDSLLIDLELDPSKVRFREVTALATSGELRLAGALDRSTGALDLQLESEALELAGAPLAELLPVPLSGRMGVSARIGGTLERPAAEGRLSWDEPALAGRALSWDGGETRFDWNGRELNLDGELPGLEGFGGGGRLERNGYEVRVELATDELGPLAAALAPAALPAAEDLQGSLAGSLVVRGTAGGAELGLRLDRLTLEREAVRLRAAEPVVIRLAAGAVHVDSLYLASESESSELFVAGRIGTGEDRELELDAQASLGSEWLELLVPGVELRGGRFELLTSIGGSVERPTLNGVGTLTADSVLVDALPVALEELEGLALFYPQRVVLDGVRARVGTGSVEAGGSIALDGALGAGYQLDLLATDLSLPYPEGWLIQGDAQVSLASTPGGRVMRGVVELERAYYLEEIRVGFESALQALFARQRQEVEETSEIKASTALNLRIRGEDALRIRNNVARVGGDVDFTLRGTLADPVLFGAVEIDPGGTLVYAGNEYEVERGALNFANPYRIEPVIDLVAVTDLREYDVRLGLSGSPQRLDVQVSSNPPLPEIEALSLLTGGSASQAPLDDRLSEPTGVAASGFLAGQAASVVTERVNRLFGLDRLRVSPLTSGGGDLSSARVTLGERISRDLFVTYSYDPSTTEEQILEIEWSVTPALLVVMTQNGDESYSLDLRWEKSF